MSVAERAARSSKELALDLISKKSLTSTTALLAYLGIADFVVHMAFAGNYGYFRDEFYYIVSGTQHLSLDYVDFPLSQHGSPPSSIRSRGTRSSRSTSSPPSWKPSSSSSPG